MADRLEDFQKFRTNLNEEILGCGHLGMKRFFALDHQAYEPGPLGTKTKELLGLVASAVLRCDDCITYHLVRCGEEGWKRDESLTPSTSRSSSAAPSPFRTYAALLHACMKSTACDPKKFALRTCMR